jgi:glycosyltransferase involved in cell wall biosynthesis
MQKFSVLMTVYKDDNPNYFRSSLNSVLDQTVMPEEIILVKDGPVPNEIQVVIDDLDKQHPAIINQLQLENNLGLGLALNKGLEVCNYELIARMDSDDISLRDRFEKQLKCFEEDHELDIVGCQVKEFVDTPENIVGARNVPLDNTAINHYARRRDPFNHPTVMYRKSKLFQFGPYGNYRKNQDTDLWIKLLSNGCKGKNVNEYLLMFRFDDSTYKKRKSWTNTKLLIKIRNNAYKIGFSSFFDYILIVIVQLSVLILPVKVQKFFYRKILRR